VSQPWWGEAAPLAGDPLPPTAGFIVVGGGIMGLATAYWLARAGVQPLLLEMDGGGAGATGRNAGFIAVGTTEPYPATVERFGREAARELLRLTLDNRQLAAELIGEEGIACEFRPAGQLQLILGFEPHADRLREAAWLAEDGCDVVMLDRSSVADLISTPLGPEISGAIALPGTALVHPGKLVRGLAAAARRRGASLLRASVRRIEAVHDGVRVVSDRGAVTGRRGLIAVNAWTGELVPRMAGHITPVRGQVLGAASVPRLFPSGMTVRLTETEEYWQQTVDGSIILGGCRAAGAGQDRGVLSVSVTGDVQEALDGVFPRLFPTLAPLRVTHRWAGPMAFTRDRLPLIGPLPPVPGCWLAGGFSGHGMALAFQLSRLVAAVLLEERPDPRLAHFSLDRPVGATT
jgi:gamma-glutamylputrescine oxidase